MAEKDRDDEMHCWANGCDGAPMARVASLTWGCLRCGTTISFSGECSLGEWHADLGEWE